MVRDYGNIPGLYAAGLYINGMVAEAALEKTGGKTDDKDALNRALRAVSLADTPRGPFSFDRFGNVIGSFYIQRCEKKGDKLVNTTIKTYPLGSGGGVGAAGQRGRGDPVDILDGARDNPAGRRRHEPTAAAAATTASLRLRHSRSRG